MSEPEQQPVPAAAPSAPPADAAAPAPAPATPAAANVPAAPEATTPPAATAPLVPGRPERRGPQGRGPHGRGGQRDGGGGQRRRPREAPPPVRDERPYLGGGGPKLKELDDEIAGELEAALAGMSADNLYAADSSQQAQAVAGQGAQRKQGKVHSIHGKDVFIEVPGGRSQGVLALEQFPDGPPKVGDTVDISIEGYDSANGLLILARKGAAVHADWSSVAEGMIVEARVVETNKGGLSVDVNGIRGFMPISQIDLYRVEKADDYVNQRLLCMVVEVKPDERNLVVSRRHLLEKQREENREKLWQELAEGQVRTGTVRNVRDFGAFVDLGGVDGLLHVSELSWQRVNDATKVLQPGQTVKVAVLKLDREARKVSLTLKGLEESPWTTLADRLPVGSTVKGTVTRTMDFGAFVEVEPGIEGLVHISELARQKVWRVTDIAKPGDEVTVKVIGLDPDQRRIALSIRQAIAPAAPEPAEDEEEADETPADVKPPKPRTTPLRGGIGGPIQIPLPPE